MFFYLYYSQEFDFSMYGNPTSQMFDKTNNVTPKRLFAVLEKCNLMTVEDRSEAIRYLNKCRDDSNRIIKVLLCTTISFHLIFLFYIYACICVFHIMSSFFVVFVYLSCCICDRVTLNHIISYHIMLFVYKLYYVISYHIISYHIIS